MLWHMAQLLLRISWAGSMNLNDYMGTVCDLFNSIVVLMNGPASILHQKQDVATSVRLSAAMTTFGNDGLARSDPKTPISTFLRLWSPSLSLSLPHPLHMCARARVVCI